MRASSFRLTSGLRLGARLFFAEALRALFRHKVRSGLASLGILIGVATVIWVIAVGEAGTTRAEQELKNLGDNFVWIEAGSRNINGVRTGTHGTTTLTPADADAIRREIPLIKSVSENVDGTVRVVGGESNWMTHYRGVSPEYLGIKRWTIATGRFFSDDELHRSANVVVMGQTVRWRLFGPVDPVGALVRMNGMAYEVVGVLGAKGQSATGQDQDDTVVLPWTTAQKKIRGPGYTWLDDILCSAVSPEAVTPAIAEATSLLRQRHVVQADEDDFNIRRPDEIIKASIEASRTLELLLVTLASIALVIGGIGIMNVMLASVMQRTREIGVRMAVGATQRAVILQFLGEAVLLSLFGAGLGVPASMAGSAVITQLLGWPISLSWRAAAFAIACSVGVGTAAGLYPAWRASTLDPLVALRSE